MGGENEERGRRVIFLFLISLRALSFIGLGEGPALDS
jgi:hypothetical protein